MNTFGIVKAGTEFVVSVGAGAVVRNTVKLTTPVDAKILQKISLGIGGAVLSSMVGDLAAKHASAKLDEAHTDFFKAKNAMQEAAAAAKAEDA